MAEPTTHEHAIYGYSVRLTLEQVRSAIGLDLVRRAAEVTRTALYALGVTEPGPLHQRCEPDRTIDGPDGEFFMPAEVIFYREGMA